MGRQAQPLLSSTVTTQRRQRPGWRVATEEGYSLIEIITVIVIVGAVAAMAIGSYSTMVPQSRLREATTELQSLLGLARVMAMSQNATITVKLSGASQSASGSGVTLTGSYTTPIVVTLTRTLSGSETPVQSQALTGEITQLTVSPGLNVPPVQPWVRYNSMGLRTGTGNQIITLTNTKGRTYSINVSPGGKAKWCMAPTCP